MRAYIACSEADEASAKALQEYLKPHGLFADVETGARGFRHLQASDVVIALWSRNSVFGTYRMQLEKRMLDAWAEEKLILVKLDHHFLPVGLRDLPVIDGAFEQARPTVAWPTVARQTKERINDLLVRAQQPLEESVSTSDIAAPPTQAGMTGGFDGPRYDPPTAGSQTDMFESKITTDEVFAKSGGRGWLWVILLAALVIGAGAFFLLKPLESMTGSPDLTGLPFGLSPTMLAVIAGASLLALILVVMIARAFGGRRRAVKNRPAAASKDQEAAEFRSKRSMSDEITEGVASSPAAFDTGDLVAEAPEQKVVVISYAHADDAEVTPVVSVVRSSGRNVWIDKGGIQAGTGWAGEIVRAIKSAGGVMVMCSSSAFESDHVKREIYLADRYRKPMLPVFLEDAQPPEDFEFFFAGVQWLQLFKLPEEERAGAVQRALAAVS